MRVFLSFAQFLRFPSRAREHYGRPTTGLAHDLDPLAICRADPKHLTLRGIRPGAASPAGKAPFAHLK